MPDSKGGCCRRRMRRVRDIRSMSRCCGSCGGSSMSTAESGRVTFDYKTRVYFGRLRHRLSQRHQPRRTLRFTKEHATALIDLSVTSEVPVSDEKSFHMTPDEFRRHGHAVVDWIADYQSRIESFPVLSQVKPGQIRASLPANPPAQGESFETIAERCRTADSAGRHALAVAEFLRLLSLQRFRARNSGRSCFLPGLGVQGMLWSTSPACTELETHVMDWLVGMLGLPEKFLSSSSGGGVIQDTASSAALCALLAARERATGYVSNKKGCDGRAGRLRFDADPFFACKKRR